MNLILLTIHFYGALMNKIFEMYKNTEYKKFYKNQKKSEWQVLCHSFHSPKFIVIHAHGKNK